MIEFKINGLDRSVSIMKRLPNELRKKGARVAAGKGAAVVRKAAKNNALRVDDPDTGRQIADNVVQRFRSKYYKRTGDVMISVGVATEKGKIPKGNPDTGRKGNTPHWHLLELGTPEMKAQPIIRPAGSQNVESATTAFVNELDRQMTKSISNAGKS